ncbi:hypothetical protein NUW58_g6084 [Xylaria curta]|uniref:Uncharacterized protein n=1 Tax=Xylaria curta TaxID=42375 RepID=A0ACC1NZR1_9PEZI|nr:hypothetical protein NUW58_g6084 [Xylaria curta]
MDCGVCGCSKFPPHLVKSALDEENYTLLLRPNADPVKGQMHKQMKANLVVAVASLLQATAVIGAFDGNLNYASPSRRHPSLGIDVPHVARRSLKRGSVAYRPEDLNFTHGVASGDPYSDSIILWTRVAPSLASDASNVTVEGPVPLYSHDTETYIKADPSPICVDWAVFPKGGVHGSTVVASGRAYTTSDIDYTVKVEAKGLKPFTTYNYQFTICGSKVKSPVGRTKTAPTAHDDIPEVKFAVFSCSNYPNGYFNAYGNAARKDNQDYFVHLGDYIYEGAAKGERAHNPPRLLFTLHDYRTRHGQYRTDPDLQLAHQNFAWITTWDDHEVSNNGYRDGSSGLNNTEDSFYKDGHGVSVDQRKMNAVRAYFEWLPIRQVDLDDNLRIWRSFRMGNLLDFIVLDTRNYDRNWNDHYIDLIRDDASRTLMGSHQENWFYNELSRSSKRGAAWRIIGNQIIFSRIYESYGLSGDNWSGYTANRNRTLKHLYDNKIGNNVFLAGDSHQNWVSDIVWLEEKEYNPETGDGSIGVEFAGTAVSSTGVNAPILPARVQAEYRVGNNSELQWQDGYYRGYIFLSVKQNSVQARFYGSPSVASRNSWDIPLANFTVRSGENKLARPVGGGSVESGALKGGKTTPTNLTLNTETGKWDVIGYDQMYIKSSREKRRAPSMASDKMEVEVAEKKLKDMDHSEQHYFNSYNHHGIHEEMLKDEVRTRSYMNAIVQNKHLFKDKVVLDVGCGTAILSMFAVKAGAKHVIGVDMSTIIFKAKEIVKVNGMEDKITLIQGKMEEIELPFPKVDIIISEWMGYFLLYESMLDTVLYARDKYLEKDGLIFPDKATIFVCGIEDGDYKDEKIGFWDNVYGFDYSPLKATALSEPLVDTVEIKAAVTDPASVITLDLYTCTTADLAFSIPFTLKCRRDDFVHALVAWFDIDFTACHKPIRFSTGPHTKYTHWKQTVFYLREVLTVQQEEEVACNIVVKPNDKNRRDLDIQIDYTLETEDDTRKAQGSCSYKMC